MSSFPWGSSMGQAVGVTDGRGRKEPWQHGPLSGGHALGVSLILHLPRHVRRLWDGCGCGGRWRAGRGGGYSRNGVTLWATPTRRHAVSKGRPPGEPAFHSQRGGGAGLLQQRDCEALQWIGNVPLSPACPQTGPCVLPGAAPFSTLKMQH